LSKALRVLGAAAVATAPGLTFAGPVHAAEAPAAPFVSEIQYDNSGGNLGEAIEIEAPVGFDLTPLRAAPSRSTTRSPRCRAPARPPAWPAPGSPSRAS
jgi:hypothetical protein